MKGAHMGLHIAKRRKELKMTQDELAEKLHISRQAVSGWEQQITWPDSMTLPKIADALGTTVQALYDGEVSESWVLKDTMFLADKMYTRMRTCAKNDHLRQFFEALAYAQKKHGNATRDPNVYAVGAGKIPYITHPLMMACQAYALGIRDDEVLASIMLHDVCEDCGVKPEELPFSKEVQEIVGLLTKDKARKKEPGYTKEYYDHIMKNPKAAIVKALDRCNNVSTMAGSFERNRLAKYITETETYVYPLFDHIKEYYLDYNDAIFVIKYQVLSLMETIKSLRVADGFAVNKAAHE